MGSCSATDRSWAPPPPPTASRRALRSISSSATGLDVISIFSLAAASSTKSMALSGRKRSAM